MNHTCPCCGYETLRSEPPGSFEICEICFWQDDSVQFNDPDLMGGANIPSFRQAQKQFLSRGERVVPGYNLSWGRWPTAADEKDPGWRPLPQDD